MKNNLWPNPSLNLTGKIMQFYVKAGADLIVRGPVG